MNFPPCQNCKKRPGTETWVGDAGAIAIAYSWMQQQWCKICVLEAQIKHAKERALEIPKLEKELEKVRKKLEK